MVVRVLQRRAIRFALLVMVLSILSGCMYPGESSPNQAAVKDYIALVQNAVDSYRIDTGVLPIKNYDMNTPLYEQNRIELRKLVERGMLGSIPPNAFAKGGTNEYVVVDPDHGATVRLLDLVSLQQANDLEKRVLAYREANYGRVPAGEELYPGWFQLDVRELGGSTPDIVSPYSRTSLVPLIGKDGRLVLDYASEIRKALALQKIAAPPADVDLRTYLVASGLYVPAKSHAYYWVEGEPRLAPPLP